MNRGSRFKMGFIVAVVGIFVVVAALVVIYGYTYLRIDYSAINHIKKLQHAPNRFDDLSGDIQVSSVDDIGFRVEGEYTLSIYYGRQVIKVSRTAFFNEEFNKRLGEIGIVIQYHVNDDGTIIYRVTYWGEVVDEYSLVT